MTKLMLVLAGVVIGLLVSLVTPTLTAQQSGAFEYMRITPYHAVQQRPGLGVQHMVPLYRSCVAAADQWTCREFDAPTSDESLQMALATAGAERWELVSAAMPVEGALGFTYIFKRQQRGLPLPQ